MEIGTPSKIAKSKGIEPRYFRPENGESWIDLNERVKNFLKEILNKHSNSENVPKILCVTHGGLITEMLNVLNELQGKELKL